MKNTPTQLEEFQKARISALEIELLRVNDELLKVKTTVGLTRITNPDFLKPLSELNKDFN